MHTTGWRPWHRVRHHEHDRHCRCEDRVEVWGASIFDRTDGTLTWTWVIGALCEHPEHYTHPRFAHRHKEYFFDMAQIQVHDDDADFIAAVVLLDAAGQPTTPDDTPQWASDNPTVCDIVSVDPTGLQATLHVAAQGTANIAFSTTDTNGTKIVAQGTVVVAGGEAVQANLTFTAPVVAAPVAAPATGVDQPPADAPQGDPGTGGDVPAPA